MCLGILQRDIDPRRIAALKISIIRAKARQRGSPNQFVKHSIICLYQNLDAGIFSRQRASQKPSSVRSRKLKPLMSANVRDLCVASA